MNRTLSCAMAVLTLLGVTATVLVAAPPAIPAKPTLAPAPAAPTPEAQKPAYLSYQFYADRYRDPFVPLLGEGRGDQGIDNTPQIAALQLKGIVSDANGRMALLTSGINSYILRGGRLYDGRNRMVKKISGVVKAESVILIGADRTVRELRAKQAL